MRKQLDLLRQRLDGLAQRERLLLLVVGAALIYGLLDASLIGPQQRKLAAMHAEEQGQQEVLAVLREELAEKEKAAALSNETQRVQREQLAEMQATLAAFEASVSRAEGDASPLGTLVRQLLALPPELSLLSLSTLPATELQASVGSSTGDGGTGGSRAEPARKKIYRHGVKFSVKGDYLTLLAYLETLQNSPLRLFWSDLGISTKTYPDAVLDVTLYTLSEQASDALR